MRDIKRRALGTVLGAAVTVVALAVPAFADTIGSTTPGTVECNANQVLVQTGAGDGYVVPDGNYVLTSWSTNQMRAGGKMAALVLRPSGGTSYTVVGASDVQDLVAGPNTFAAALPTQGGDLLGFWVTAWTTCHTTDSGTFAASDVVSQVPTMGSTVSAPYPITGRLAISAVIERQLPTSTDQCKKGGWANFGSFKNQGDCVSFVASGGRNQPALG
jgi:hypothetical protein